MPCMLSLRYKEIFFEKQSGDDETILIVYFMHALDFTVKFLMLLLCGKCIKRNNANRFY